VKCELGLSVSPSPIPSSGGTGRLTVTTTPECAWTASENLTWISQLSPASGQGGGEIGFQAAPNTGSAPRQGDVTVSGVTIQVQQNAATCTFQLGSTSATAAAAGGPQSVSVTTLNGCGWTAVSGATWITVTSGASGNGSGTVNFDVATNSGAARNGTLTIAGQTFTVSQNGVGGQPCTFSLSPTSQSIGAAGGPGTSSVTAGNGCAWTATSNVPWITITAGAAGTGNGTVNFTTAANSAPARQGTLTIAGQTFTVNQSAGCAYSISPTSQSIGPGVTAGSSSVTTSGGCSWTATSNASWITITSGATGNGPGVVNFSAAANAGPARQGTLTIAGQTFTVNQATACTYSVSPTSQSVGAGGGNGSTTVTTGSQCTWSIVSNAPWISFNGSANRTGGGNVNFSSAANAGPARQSTLTIAGQTFTINQASGCAVSINPMSRTHGALGGSGTVTVTAGAGCTWTAVSNASWITIVTGASGTGNGTVTYAVAVKPPTPTGNRVGTITIGGQTFTVTQTP
jgi:all-beta uncharacterized protein/BACON domain-containing protein